MNSAGFSVGAFGRSFRKRSVACNTIRTRFRFDSFVWQRCQLSHCELSTANESIICCLMPDRHLLPNRKTALCHSGSRNMGGSPSGDAVGRAREDIPTHRPSRKENVSPLNGALTTRHSRQLLHKPSCLRVWPTRAEMRHGHRHSEDCGFPFALTFEGGARLCCPNTHYRASSDNDGTARLSLGEVSGFSALFFLLGFRYSRLVSLNSSDVCLNINNT